MDIEKPTIVLNENICKRNISRMVDKAKRHSLSFKPHMKTHQSAEIGRWFKEAGVKAITVSSLTMAQYFADHGWKDITIAFPCNVRELNRINDLASKIELTLLVTSPKTAETINRRLSNSVQCYIEIDTGAHRSGFSTSKVEAISSLIDYLKKAENITWIGFYSHPGHSYNTRSKEEIIAQHELILSQIKDLKKKLLPDYGKFEVCIGDTPCCSVAKNFEAVDAISPGNFVFYDLMQHQIGSCTIPDIAFAVYCPIVDMYPDRKEIIIYGGAVHFSKEKLQHKTFSHYGFVASPKNDGWRLTDKKSYLKSISQEHGIISCSQNVFDQYSIGDLITILPVHSCLTANTMGSYQLENGQRITQLK